MSVPQTVDKDYDIESDVFGVARRDGSLLRTKAIMLTEAGFDNLGRHLLSELCTHKERMEILAFTADIAQITGKHTQALQQTNAAFSIKIDLSSLAPSLSHDDAVVVEATPVAVLDVTPEVGDNADLKGGL